MSPITNPIAAFDVPEMWNIEIDVATPRDGTAINVGDWLAYSGQRVFPTNAGHSAYWKASGAGVALEASPTYDQAGRIVTATALRYLRQGVIHASAAFSGVIPLGQAVYPASTGSGVAAPTGQSGVGATWQTGVKLPASGATGAGGSGVGVIVGYTGNGAGGTGELDILITPSRPDFY